MKRIPFSEELGDKICELIEHGSALTAISSLDYMPCKFTILRWSVDENKRRFGANYAKAYRVRILAQIEERDELALTEVVAKTIAEVVEEYDLSIDDDKMISLYIRSDLQSRQVDRKVRLDHLGKSIGQLLQVFDARFTSRNPDALVRESEGFAMANYPDESVLGEA